MIKSIMLKEWLKLKWFLNGCLLLNIGVCFKILLDIRQRLHAEHAEMVWYQAIHLHSVLYQDIRFVILATSLVLAAAQFVPEMLGRRMRIALHLPIGRNRLVTWSMLSGLLFFSFVTLADWLFVFSTIRFYFPEEVAAVVLPTMLPWYLAGVVGYCATTCILLETTRSRRVFLSIVFTIVVSIFFSGHGYSWLVPALPLLIVCIPLSLLSVYESARRFQQRGA